MTKVFTSSDFPVGQSMMTLYPVWQRKYVLEFDSGEANDRVHKMTPIVVVDSTPTSLPICIYEHGEKVNIFTYHDSDKWEKVQHNVPVEADKFRFIHWECIVNGKTTTFDSGEKIIIDKPITSSPIVRMTARWGLGYDMMKFMVDGDLYCEVLIDKKTNKLKYPDHNPRLIDEKTQFNGWSMVEDTYLGGILDYVPMVCNDESGNSEFRVVCQNESGSSEPIVCLHDDILVYDTVVSASLYDPSPVQLTLTFKYINGEDQKGELEWTDKVFYVAENQRLPFFQVNNPIMEHDGKKLVFRYWKLENGNLTS